MDAGGARQTIGGPHGCGPTNVSELECNDSEATLADELVFGDDAQAMRRSDSFPRLFVGVLDRQHEA
jgi:hypothetical protein